MELARIYLDHAATTPIHPAVTNEILRMLRELPGNPSSISAEGRAAREALDRARGDIAHVLQADPEEIVFTSGGSESIALAIRGTAIAAARENRKHLVTTAIEHHAVLHTIQHLRNHHGFEATIVAVDSVGQIDPAAVLAAVRNDTALVSVMYANNEVGSIQPLATIAAELETHPAVLHSDAIQAPGLLPITIPALGVDLMSIAAHKFYGPKGIGVLYVRRGTRLSPQIIGGNQERGQRAGTENVAFAVGLSTALTHAEQYRASNVSHNSDLRDALIGGIASIPGSRLNGPYNNRLANNVNVVFKNVDSESLLLRLDAAGIAASSGSACTSASLEPSHVLQAMGLSPDLAAGSLRLTTGRENTMAQINRTIEILHDLVPNLQRTYVAKLGGVE
jgi:cysteine desulfurase